MTKMSKFFILIFLFSSLSCVKKKPENANPYSGASTFKNNYRDYNLPQGQGYFNTCWSVSLVALAEHVFYMKNPASLKKLKETGVRDLVLNADYLMFQELAESFSSIVRNSSPEKVAALMAEYYRHGALVPSFDGGYVSGLRSTGELGGLALLDLYGVRKLEPGGGRLHKILVPEVAESFIDNIQMSFAQPFLRGGFVIPPSWRTADGIAKDILSQAALFRGLNFQTSSPNPSQREEVKFMRDVVGFNPREFREFIIRDNDTFEIGMSALRRALAESYIVPMAIGLDSRALVSPKLFSLPKELGKNEKDWILDIHAAHVVNVVAAQYVGQSIEDVKNSSDETLQGNVARPVSDIASLIVQNSANPDEENLDLGVYAKVTTDYLKALVQTELKKEGSATFSLVLPKHILDSTDASILQDGVRFQGDSEEKSHHGFVAVECNTVRSGLNPLGNLMGSKYNVNYWNLINQRDPTGGILTLSDQRWLFFGYGKDKVPPNAVRLKSETEMALWKRLIFTLDGLTERASLSPGEKCWQETFEISTGDGVVRSVQGVGPMKTSLPFGSYNVASNLAKAECFRLATEMGYADSACQAVSSDSFVPVAGCHPYVSKRVLFQEKGKENQNKYAFLVPALSRIDDLKTFKKALTVPLQSLGMKVDLKEEQGRYRNQTELENCPKPDSKIKQRTADFLYGEGGLEGIDSLSPPFFY
jgi:hypothetical protein